MGNRKRLSADARKEVRKNEYFASLRNVPTSPRKMRLVADMVRGMEVSRALGCTRREAPSLGYRQLGTKEWSYR